MSASMFPLGRRAQQAGAEKGAFLEVEGLSAGEKTTESSAERPLGWPLIILQGSRAGRGTLIRALREPCPETWLRGSTVMG